ncbi:hypothetical protein PF007_g16433 [Phytophthora fragariae]|uniref:Uncharacterized protein n=1 Tax=Phytophthora fragariae TaxID=53985 RepID=A0A6A3JRG5_9STRA|nr:hypothetical protein PF011_g16823 [Phytophthora fragariae]KAE9097972.1 hypothetical protein PF007_g16433 [Phytophthora fragariae]
MSLVVRYWGEALLGVCAHLNARNSATDWSRARKNTTGEVNINAEGTDNQSKPNVDGAMEESQQGSLQEPWDQGSWDGNIDELRQRLMGLTIPHELQCEIHIILEQAEPRRYAEQLAFLVNTASQLNQPHRKQILAIDLQDDSQGDTPTISDFAGSPTTMATRSCPGGG